MTILHFPKSDVSPNTLNFMNNYKKYIMLFTLTTPSFFIYPSVERRKRTLLISSHDVCDVVPSKAASIACVYYTIHRCILEIIKNQ